MGISPNWNRPLPTPKPVRQAQSRFPLAIDVIGMTLRTFLSLSATLFGAVLLPHAAAAARAGVPTEWVAAWATALQSIPDMANPPPLYRTPEVAGRTVREIVYPTLSGPSVRLHVSNAYGRAPLALGDVRLAQSADGAAARTETSTRVTFGGRASITLQPGDEIDSDAVPMQLHAGAPYAISMHVGAEQPLTAWHRVSNQLNYVSMPGDHTADSVPGAYVTKFTESAWVTGVDVQAPSSAAIVAIGDSITDGLRSSLNRNRRWPDALARRLADAGDRSTAILNLGISGNRLLSDSPCYGEALERRFDRDALGHPGVKAVILLIGINDINFASMPPRAGLDCDFPHTAVTAEDLIGGYRRVIDKAHHRGVRIFGATLTPASLPPQRERIRLAANAWIRTSGAFDGVIDFDAALRDPARPERLQRRYDSGDHIHPGDDGYAAMAAAVALGPVTAAARR